QKTREGSWRLPRSAERSRSSSSAAELLKNQARVFTSETRVQIHGDLHGIASGDAGNVVQIAAFLGFGEIDGGRDDAAMDRQRADDRFEGTGPARQMAGDRLGAADGEAAGVIPKEALDGPGLDQIVALGGRGVRVDVVALVGAHVGRAQ